MPCLRFKPVVLVTQVGHTGWTGWTGHPTTLPPLLVRGGHTRITMWGAGGGMSRCGLAKDFRSETAAMYCRCRFAGEDDSPQRVLRPAELWQARPRRLDRYQRDAAAADAQGGHEE